MVVQSARELPPPIFASLANLAREQALLGKELLKELASQAMANCLYGGKRLTLPKERVTC